MGFLRPQVLIDNGLNKFERFIETGTSNGAGLERMQRLFKSLVSVEIDAGLAMAASRRLHAADNVRIYCGSSPEFLSAMIDPAISTLFFLDAHYMHYRREPESKGYMSADVPQCPLMDELKAIFSFKWSAPFAILIDDAYLFQGFYRARRFKAKGYKIEQWPTEADIAKLAADNGYGLRALENMFLLEKA